MVGKNPLSVAKQHGHSISTMLRVYAAWAEGAVESDVDAIKRSMNRHARLKPVPQPRPTTLIGNSPGIGNLAVDLPVQPWAKTQVPDNWWEILAEREGFEPSKGF
jgi:hypothetical protein